VTFAALVALGVIIVSGAAVRLSGSGMGCPTWPQCEQGSLVPRGETGHHGWIEYGNRLFTGVVSVAVILAVLGSLVRVPRRRDLTRWSLGLVAGVFAQAILGGIVVLFHVAPVAVMGHYLLSAVLVWNAVVLHHKAGEPEGERRPVAEPSLLRLGRWVVAAGAVVLVTGTVVTGAGPHGGDEAADRLPVAVSSVVPVHGAAVWLFLALAVTGILLARRAGNDLLTSRASVLLGCIVAQGAIGYTQYFSGVPELLVGAHVLGSVIVWIAALRFFLALRAPAPDPSLPATSGREDQDWVSQEDGVQSLPPRAMARRASSSASRLASTWRLS
jgi:heme a synthase